MDKLYALLDKARPSTCVLDLSFLSHSRILSNHSPHFSYIIDFSSSLMDFPNGKQTYCFYFITRKQITLLLSSHPIKLCAISLLPFTAKFKEKGILYIWSPVPPFPFFLESTLNKLLLLPLHHFYQYHPLPQVFILLVFQQYLTQLNTPSPHWACKTYFIRKGMLLFILVSGYYSFLYVECPKAQALYLFSFLSILIPLVGSSKIMPLSPI